MADNGARSIEVDVRNNTTANLTVQGADLDGQGASWIKGEEPKQGDTLNQYQSMRAGVMNTDYNSGAGGSFTLTGYGSPFEIEFNNDPQGNSSCSSNGNDEVSVEINKVDTGETNHSQFDLTLQPK